MSTSMSIGSINPLSYVQSILTSAVQSAGLTTNTNSNSLSSLAATSSGGPTSDGNTTAATQLNQLATDFTSASKSGQLPSVQDLAQAVGGHHHHHHHAH